jgi:argininosuccinate synthase
VGDNRSLLLHHLEAMRALGSTGGGPSLAALLGTGKDE